MTRDTDTSGMKVWVSPEKEPRLANVLAKGGGNTEWVGEEGIFKYQARPCDQQQNRIIVDMGISAVFCLHVCRYLCFLSIPYMM